MSRRPQYVQNTVNVVPSCYISSAHGSALLDETLEDIATSFLGIDTEFVGVLDSVLNNAASGRITLDTDSHRTLQQDQAMVSDIKAQILDVRAGRRRFHEHYLRQRQIMLPIWQRSVRCLSQMLDLDRNDLDNRPFLDDIDALFHNIERHATPMIDLLPAAATKGVLDREDRAVIRLRMLQLDEAFDIYHRKTSSTRTLKTWPEIQARIDSTTQHSQQNASVSSSTASVLKSSSADFSGLILWCTIIATSIVSIPIIVKAYQFSSHEPGTWEDSDAWFLLQSSGMQILNLVTAFIPTYRDKTINTYTRRWMLALMVTAACCVVSSVIIYKYLPTEWSSMLACVAPIVQAFILYQLLVEKKGKRD